MSHESYALKIKIKDNNKFNMNCFQKQTSMLHFLIIGFLFASSHGGVLPDIPHEVSMDWNRSGKIVGGEIAIIHDAPYTVLLYINVFQTCAGSIISKNNILTAAHCLSGTSPSSWTIRAGSTYSDMGGVILNAERFAIHKDYNAAKIDFDIALIFLENEIPLNGESMATVPLPKQGLEVTAGTFAFVTGWGASEEGGPMSTVLQKVYIPIVAQSACENAYGSGLITPRMICAGYIKTGGQDACQGDAGGPLTVLDVLIGITSWGYGCARPDYPGVWTRVPYFRDWIDEQIL